MMDPVKFSHCRGINVKWKTGIDKGVSSSNTFMEPTTTSDVVHEGRGLRNPS